MYRLHSLPHLYISITVYFYFLLHAPPSVRVNPPTTPPPISSLPTTSCYCKIIIFALSAVLLRSPWVNMESLKVFSLSSLFSSSSVPPFQASVLLALRAKSLSPSTTTSYRVLQALGRASNVLFKSLSPSLSSPLGDQSNLRSEYD